MNMSRHSVLARLAAVGTLGAAALLGAAPAGASISPTIITPNEQRSDYPGHCAKVEIVYARGTAEPPNQSWALNGFNYSGQDYWGSSRNSPYSVWFQITKDLGNRMIVPSDGSAPYHEYTMEYDQNHSTPSKRGRSDFYLYNLDYPATLDFLGYQPSQNYSVQKGTRSLIKHLNNETVRCPDKKFMLFGYSQGALIVANAISNEADWKYIYENSDNPMPELQNATKERIVSVGMLADAGFNSREKVLAKDPVTLATRLEWNHVKYSGELIEPGVLSWRLDEGTPSETNGRRNIASGPLTGDAVRGQLEAPPVGPVPGRRSDNWYYPEFEKRIRNYCVLTDPICNRSATDAGEHLNYFDNGVPRRDLAIFAVRQLRASDPRWAGQPEAKMHESYDVPDEGLLPTTP